MTPGTTTTRALAVAVAVVQVLVAVVVVVAVAVATTLVAPPAWASAAVAPGGPAGRIDQLDPTTPGVVRMVYTADGLPAGVGLDPGSVTLALQRPGQDPVGLDVTVSPLDGEVVRRTAVLTVDTSGSLDEDDIAAVREAATSFLDSVPPTVEVGLVTFGDPALPRVDPTRDREAVRSVLSALEADGGTALYDAAVAATDMLPGVGVQRILLLTDGADDNAEGTGPGSEESLESAVAAVESSGANLTAVAFGAGASLDPLAALAAAGGGRVLDAAQAEDLAGAFQAEADSIATALSVTATVPTDLAGSRGNLVLTAGAGGLTLTSAAFASLAAPPAPAPSTAPSPASTPVSAPVDVAAAEPVPAGSPLLWSGLAGLLLALLTAAGVVVRSVLTRDPQQVRRARSLAAYTLRPRGSPSSPVPPGAPAPTRLGRNVIARSAVMLAGRAVERGNGTERLARALEAASLPLRPGEWVVLQAVIAVGAAGLLLVLSAGNLPAMLLGLVLGGIGPRVYLAVRTTRRERAFVRVMPDTLGLMASGLRAGYSLPQAMDSVAREGQEPLRTEFARALVEVRLGVPPEDAMERIADRMSSRDFRWVVMAVRIQRDVGGNLAELLDTVAGTLRERARLRRQVDVLSAEGRLSAWIVGLLPVAFCLYLLVVQPGYLRPLYEEPLGIALLLFGGVLFLVGLFGLRWAVTVDV